MQRRDGVRAIERAMVEIARDLDRRDLGRHVGRRLGRPVDSAHILVIDAVDEGSESGEPPTVGTVARLLGVHPSRASRTVQSAIRAGLVVRTASQADGRRSCLELTAGGSEIAKAIRGARARYFAARMKSWSRSDRREFAKLFVRFSEARQSGNGETLAADPESLVAKDAAAAAASARSHAPGSRSKTRARKS
jgi:DNA-binding MarR family transcriptional regulator